MKHLLNALLVCLSLTRVGHAVVVEDTNILFRPRNPVLLEYSARTYPQPSTNDIGYHEASFQMLPVAVDHWSVQLLEMTLGGVQTTWYGVQPGDVFSAATIAGGQFQPIGSSPVNVVGSDDFYLGADLTISFQNPNAPHAYGWLHIHNNNFVLEGIGNAMAYHNSGIVVGTLIEVPEPAGCILMALASIGLLCCAQYQNLRARLNCRAKPK